MVFETNMNVFQQDISCRVHNGRPIDKFLGVQQNKWNLKL